VKGQPRSSGRVLEPHTLMLFTTTLLIVRNQRILRAWNARQQENTRRAAAGLPPKTRKRRRKTLAGLAALTPAPRDHEPRARHHHHDSRHNRAKACPDTRKTRVRPPPQQPKTPQPGHRLPAGQNVSPKRELGPH
jgi:hypothetical protein